MGDGEGGKKEGLFSLLLPSPFCACHAGYCVADALNLLYTKWFIRRVRGPTARFVTQVTSVTQFNAIFVTPKCRVLRCNSFIKHGDFQRQLFSLLSRRSAFLYGTKKRHVQSSDLKMLQHRDYCLQKIVFVNKKTGFSVVMLHYPKI